MVEDWFGEVREGGSWGDGGGDYIYVTYNDTCTIHHHVKKKHNSVLTLQYLFYLHFINVTLLTYGAHYCKRPRQIMQKMYSLLNT